MDLHDFEELTLSFPVPLPVLTRDLAQLRDSLAEVDVAQVLPRWRSDPRELASSCRVRAPLPALLRMLALPIIDFQPLSTTLLSSFRVIAHCLRMLEIGHSSAQKIGDPAAFVAYVFPGLQLEGMMEAEERTVKNLSMLRRRGAALGRVWRDVLKLLVESKSTNAPPVEKQSRRRETEMRQQ
ncbi:hypothetical protein BKA93DRAFT_825883 [Sparassis latifolia]